MTTRERVRLLSGILFSLIFGTLLHFFYEWSGENAFVALFSPVNESVWEHLKMLFFPILLYTLFEIIVLKKFSAAFLASRVVGMLFGMLLIVVSYFTYTGVTGLHSLVMDILIFLFGILAAFFISFLWEAHPPRFRLPTAGSLSVLILLCASFFSFTFSPPELPVFLPPVQSVSSIIRLLPR